MDHVIAVHLIKLCGYYFVYVLLDCFINHPVHWIVAMSMIVLVNNNVPTSAPRITLIDHHCNLYIVIAAIVFNYKIILYYVIIT